MNENTETASEVVDAAPKDATSTALAEISRVEQGLAKLTERHKGVIFDVSSGAGMDAARKARAEIREVRYGVQNAVEAAKKHLNGLKKDVETRGHNINARLLLLEDPIHASIKAEEDRKAREKAEREARERAERDAILLRLEEIRNRVLDLQGYPSAEIEKAIDALATIDTASFGEFEPAAMRAIGETAGRLKAMSDAAKLAEQQEAANRAERERLEAERRAHEEKMAAERAEMERQKAELKRQQDEAAAAERARKEAAEAEARRVAAERERQEKAERDAKAAEARAAAERAAQAERELAEARAKVEGAANQMLIALVSVRDWDHKRAMLPQWIADQVYQALDAAGAPAIATAATEEAVHG